jgi:hypothetical protein
MKTLAEELAACPKMPADPGKFRAAQEAHARRMQRWGWSCTAIARELGLKLRAVERMLQV